MLWLHKRGGLMVMACEEESRRSLQPSSPPAAPGVTSAISFARARCVGSPGPAIESSRDIDTNFRVPHLDVESEHDSYLHCTRRQCLEIAFHSRNRGLMNRDSVGTTVACTSSTGYSVVSAELVAFPRDWT